MRKSAEEYGVIRLYAVNEEHQNKPELKDLGWREEYGRALSAHVPPFRPEWFTLDEVLRADVFCHGGRYFVKYMEEENPQ